MKISNSAYSIQSAKQTSFGNGKVHFYTDCDHTFIPSSIYDFQDDCYGKQFELTDYFSRMSEFLKIAGRNFRYTITTARSIDEFIETGYCAIRNKIKVPWPNEVIALDGRRKYVKLFPDFIGGAMQYYPAFLSCFSRDSNGVKDKKYDTVREVFNNLTNDKGDFVIAAGDGSNDINMLNPMSYLEHYKQQFRGDSDYHLDYELSPEGVKRFLDRNHLGWNFITKLPFVGIVIYRDKYPDRFTNLINSFGPKAGELQKLVVVKEGHLLDGLKQAIELLQSQFSKNRKPSVFRSSELKKSVINAAKIL